MKRVLYLLFTDNLPPTVTEKPQVVVHTGRKRIVTARQPKKFRKGNVQSPSLGYPSV